MEHKKRGEAPTSQCPGWDSQDGRCCFASPQAIDRDIRGFCQDFLRCLRRKHGLLLASLRSVDPVHRKLIYLASDGAGIADLRKPVLDWSESGNLSGIAAESRKVTFFEDINRARGGRRYAHPWLVSRLGLKSAVSIPILNTCNINQVLLILNLYPGAAWLSLNQEEATRLGDALAIRFENFLRDRCVRCANRLRIAMCRLKDPSPERMFSSVVRVLGQTVGASSIGIYIERGDRQGVELRSSTGQVFDAEHSSDIDELATRCWSDNREFLTISRAEAPVMYPGEFLPPPIPNLLEKTPSSVFVPLRDMAGKARGVFCCLKGTGEGWSYSPTPEGSFPFTYEDIALIEAISQAFAPQFEILMSNIRRTESLNKLAHELRVPVVAFRAALEYVENECKSHKYVFQYDHFNELSTYCDLMTRLLQRLDAVRGTPQAIPLRARKVHILSEIIPPAVRFLGSLLDRKNLAAKGITYLGKVPNLYLDPDLMTTVVFNLLDNAIKYAHRDAQQFKIEIEGDTTDLGVEVVFRDWGIGVPEGWENDIFDSGVRGPNACEHEVTGQGLGLWFAREIIRRHGGDLVLRKRIDPTTFATILPVTLKDEPPKDEPTER